MINNFGDIKLSEYRPVYRGLPVEEFAKSLEKLEARYDKNLMFSQQLEETVDKLNVENHNKDILDNAKLKLNTTLTGLVNSNELEYAEKSLYKAATDFKNSDLLKEAVEDYTMYSGWLTDISARGLDRDDPERINAWKRYYADTRQRLARDENGNVVNRFNLPKPVDTPDFAKQALDFAKEYKADKFIGADIGNTSTDRSTHRLQPKVKIGNYDVTLSTEIIDNPELRRDITDYLLTNPKNVAYLNEMAMLNNHFTRDAPIEGLLESVGVTGLDITRSLIQQGVAKEEVVDENILRLESKLNDIQTRAKNLKPNDAKGIQRLQDEYQKTEEELGTAIETRKTAVISNKEYEDELRNLYSSKYKMSLINRSISAVANSQDMIKQDADWKQDQFAIEAFKMSLQKKQQEELFDMSIGNTPGMNAKSLITSIDGDGYKLYNNFITEFNPLEVERRKLKEGEKLSPEKESKYQELKGKIQNYRNTVNVVIDELVATGELSKDDIESAYNTYKEHGGKMVKEGFLAYALSRKAPRYSKGSIPILESPTFHYEIIPGDNNSRYTKGQKLVVTDPLNYAVFVAGTNGLSGKNFETKLDHAKTVRERSQNLVYVTNSMPLRAMDEKTSAVLFQTNKELSKWAINGELLTTVGNRSLHEQLKNDMQYFRFLKTADGEKVNSSTAKFIAEIGGTKGVNGQTEIIVTVMNEDGTKALFDDSGNPIHYVTYASGKDQQGWIDERFDNITNAALKSDSYKVRAIGSKMRAGSHLIGNLHARDIDTEKLRAAKGTKFNFETTIFKPNTNQGYTQPFQIGVEGSEYVLYRGGQKINSSRGILSSEDIYDLGNMFANWLQETGQRPRD